MGGQEKKIFFPGKEKPPQNSRRGWQGRVEWEEEEKVFNPPPPPSLFFFSKPARQAMGGRRERGQSQARDSSMPTLIFMSQRNNNLDLN